MIPSLTRLGARRGAPATPVLPFRASKMYSNVACDVGIFLENRVYHGISSPLRLCWFLDADDYLVSIPSTMTSSGRYVVARVGTAGGFARKPTTSARCLLTTGCSLHGELARLARFRIVGFTYRDCDVSRLSFPSSISLSYNYHPYPLHTSSNTEAPSRFPPPAALCCLY